MRASMISPQEWGWLVASATSAEPIPGLEISPAELERRLRANTYEWLPRQFDEKTGAFYGNYCASQQSFEPPQTANLIAPWQLLAAYDRYGDEWLLAKARRAAEWFYERFVMSHPVSVAVGGVRDSLRPEELWTKYTAEFAILSTGLYRRSGEREHLHRARQSAGFLVQSARRGFAPKYDRRLRQWRRQGWLSFGRVIEAFFALAEATADAAWLEHALHWGEFALTRQAADGGFYLIDDDYFNTDLAADELRALVFLHEHTRRQGFLQAAQRFADWLLAWQRPDGAWPLTVDRDRNVVVATVGPGDVPNIGMALFRLHVVSGQEKYRRAAMAGFRYALGAQAIPGSKHPYLADSRVRCGFWSWDPYYDYTLSADQSTHHVRGMMFLLDTQARASA